MHKLTLFLAFLTPFLQAQQPSTRTIQDRADHLTFDLPTTWTVSTRDHEVSTFHHEARTAPPNTRLRYVLAMPENPFPFSTFSGAHFYISLIPHLKTAQCAAQVTPPSDVTHPKSLNDAIEVIGDRKTSHGYDEHGVVCTEFRDDIYTVPVQGGCLRFDLAMNNFCGGEVSGVRDMTHEELLGIRQQMETILKSVRIGP